MLAGSYTHATVPQVATHLGGSGALSASFVSSQGEAPQRPEPPFEQWFTRAALMLKHAAGQQRTPHLGEQHDYNAQEAQVDLACGR